MKLYRFERDNRLGYAQSKKKQPGTMRVLIARTCASCINRAWNYFSLNLEIHKTESITLFSSPSSQNSNHHTAQGPGAAARFPSSCCSGTLLRFLPTRALTASDLLFFSLALCLFDSGWLRRLQTTWLHDLATTFQFPHINRSKRKEAVLTSTLRRSDTSTLSVSCFIYLHLRFCPLHYS